MTDLVLVHPPLALPCEPPPGPATLAGALRARGHELQIFDASIEALTWFVRREAATGSHDPRVRRLARAWDGLRGLSSYASRATHHAHLREAGLGLTAAARARGPYRLSLTDYVDERRDPYRSPDLLDAARAPFDNLFGDYLREHLIPRIVASRPRLVGLSLNYRQQALLAAAIAGALREALPGLPVIAGGGLISAWIAGPGQVDPLLDIFDALVAGEGVEALSAWLDGDPRGPGVLWREDGALRHQPPLRFQPALLAPSPDFSDLPLDAYLAPSPVLAFPSSRGCYWRRCAFCPEALQHEQGFASLGGEALAARLAALGERHDARHAHLTDSSIAPAVLRELAALPAPDRPVRWYGFARFEKELLDPALCQGLARAGCHALQLGLESGSQRLLDLIGKGLRLERVAPILRNLHEAGIATFVYVLVGMPSETLAEAAATRDLLVANAAHIDFLHASVMNLPIGSPLQERPEDYLLPLAATEERFPSDLSLCRNLKSTGAEDRRALRRFLSEDIARHPRIRPILRRTPPQLGANHVLFEPAR